MITDATQHPRLIDKAKPPSPLAGRLSRQSLLLGLGRGTFMTGSAVFFTQVVGLTVVQIGLGLTIAGIAGFSVAYPMGKLVDRIGPKRCWSISAAGQGAMFAAWPFIDGFQAYIAMAIVMEVIGSLGLSAYRTYTIDVLPPSERVTSRAYMYSAHNVGFTLGSLVGGIALAFESIALLSALPWFTAAVFSVNAFAITRLPGASHDLKTADERRVRVSGPGPMKNVGWLAAMFLSATLRTNQVILHLVIPLWLVEKTDAPWVVLAILFGTNTVMCVFLPLLAARGVKDNATALRAIRLSTAFFVVSCVITLSTHHSVGLWTVLLFFLGLVALTGAELYLAAATWTFEAELMDPRRRGEYQGAAELSSILGRVWAPALYTFLAISWGSAGWLMIAGIITMAAVALHPAVAMAQRFLERHVPVDILADASACAGTDGLPPGGPVLIELHGSRHPALPHPAALLDGHAKQTLLRGEQLKLVHGADDFAPSCRRQTGDAPAPAACCPGPL